jgi:hypothetical protein
VLKRRKRDEAIANRKDQNYLNLDTNQEVRQVLTQKELLGGVFLDQYQIEQMNNDHAHFKNLTIEIR